MGKPPTTPSARPPSPSPPPWPRRRWAGSCWMRRKASGHASGSSASRRTSCGVIGLGLVHGGFGVWKEAGFCTQWDFLPLASSDITSWWLILGAVQNGWLARTCKPLRSFASPKRRAQLIRRKVISYNRHTKGSPNKNQFCVFPKKRLSSLDDAQRGTDRQPTTLRGPLLLAHVCTYMHG